MAVKSTECAQVKVVGMTPEELRGVVCRKCGCADLRVYRTVPKPMMKNPVSGIIRSGYVVRERLCRNCGTKIITRETEVR